jgi:hypothetical protein
LIRAPSVQAAERPNQQQDWNRNTNQPQQQIASHVLASSQSHNQLTRPNAVSSKCGTGLRLREFISCAWLLDWEIVMLGTILIVILILILLGALPTWPYSSGWGYYPSGGIGLVLVILLILVVMGRV